MKTFQKGFTLIELMIVVAIVGILASIALPAYRDYMVRARTTEPMAKLDEMKLSVAEFYSANGKMPSTNASAGYPAAATVYGSYVSDYGINYIDDTAAQVAVELNTTLHADLAGVWIVLSGKVAADNNTVNWACSTDADPEFFKYLPSNCRSAPATTFTKETT
jgi:type IV pilus assembly protein PilA